MGALEKNSPIQARRHYARVEIRPPAKTSHQARRPTENMLLNVDSLHLGLRGKFVKGKFYFSRLLLLKKKELTNISRDIIVT